MITVQDTTKYNVKSSIGQKKKIKIFTNEYHHRQDLEILFKMMYGIMGQLCTVTEISYI